MILVAIGANLPSEAFGSPRAACEAALGRLTEAGIRIVRRSRWYESDPVPVSDQPKYVNGVAAVETGKTPQDLLATLLEIEAGMGRTRSARNAARIIDLDLLDYRGRVVDEPSLTLPHPRLAERAFVVLPLRDVAPDWRHPVTGKTVAALAAALPNDQHAEPIAEAARESP